MNINLVENNILWKYISNLEKEFKYGGYLSAVGAPSLVATVSLIMGVSINLPILVLSYLVPLIIYSFDYYKDLDKDMATNLERSSYLKKKSKVYPYILGSYILILSLLLIKYANISLIIFILLLAAGGFLYSTTLKKITKKMRCVVNFIVIGVSDKEKFLKEFRELKEKQKSLNYV